MADDDILIGASELQERPTARNGENIYKKKQQRGFKKASRQATRTRRARLRKRRNQKSLRERGRPDEVALPDEVDGAKVIIKCLMIPKLHIKGLKFCKENHVFGGSLLEL